MAKRPQKKTTNTKTSFLAKDKHIPVREHLHELRRRVVVVAIVVGVGTAVAYSLQRQLVQWLLAPSHGQQFIYTTPMSGINFLFGICLDIGLILGFPVIVYEVLAFLRPILPVLNKRFVTLSAAAVMLVALIGVAFGYFVGLPNAMKVLLSQFSFIGNRVHPLLTIQDYLNFVKMYLTMSALLFQLPLIIMIINHIKPLKPSGMLKYERHVLVLAVIMAFIMDPTPNMVDQLIVIVPIVAMYQLSIVLVWLSARRRERVAKRKAAAEAELDLEQDKLKEIMDEPVTLPVYSVPPQPVAIQPIQRPVSISPTPKPSPSVGSSKLGGGAIDLMFARPSKVQALPVTKPVTTKVVAKPDPNLLVLSKPKQAHGPEYVLKRQFLDFVPQQTA